MTKTYTLTLVAVILIASSIIAASVAITGPGDPVFPDRTTEFVAKCHWLAMEHRAITDNPPSRSDDGSGYGLVFEGGRVNGVPGTGTVYSCSGVQRTPTSRFIVWVDVL